MFKDKSVSQQEGFLFLDPSVKPQERVDNLLSLLSVEEKIAFMASRQPAINRLGIKEFHIGGEAAHGLVASGGFATVFPQTHGLACTWDEKLLNKIGIAVSDEARAYYNRRKEIGGLCLWAPTIDMERDPRWGRNEESYGEDPVLTSRLSAAYMAGMQGDHPFYLKTIPTPKHFYANNNETLRGSCSVNLNSRIKREYYLKVFESAFRLNKFCSLMTSYNAINGTPAMLIPDLEKIVRKEWGFEGFVVSDGGAFTQLKDLHGLFADYASAIAASIKAGVDNLSDDSRKVMAAVREALDRDLLDESDLDKAIGRVFLVRLRLGHFDPKLNDPYARLGESVIECRSHRELSLEAAKKSIVLLKNDYQGNPVLPLDEKKIGKLAVLGPLANIVYRGWYSGRSSYSVSPLRALTDRLSPAQVVHADGSDIVTLSVQSGMKIGTKSWYDGVLVANRDESVEGEFFRRTDFGWGNQTFRSLINGCYIKVNEKGLLEADAEEVYAWYVKSRFDLRQDDSEGGICYSWNGIPIGLNKDGELALVHKSAQELALMCKNVEELALMRKSAEDDALVRKSAIDLTLYADKVEKIKIDVRESGIENAVRVASEAECAIVFVGNNPVLVAKEEFDRPDICLPPDQIALLEAVADANPRTIAVIISGYPYSLGSLEKKLAAVVYMAHGGPEGGNALAQTLFGEYNPAGRLPMTWYKNKDQLPDLFDYDLAHQRRTYQYFREPVLFPFGHGLSYSHFTYQSLMPVSSVLKSGSKLSFVVKVSNDTARSAEEVVQFYVSCRKSSFHRVQRGLVDFQRILFAPFETRTVEFFLDEEALKIWDPVHQKWFLESSEWEAQIGASSSDIRCTAGFSVNAKTMEARDPGVWNCAESFLEAENYLLKEIPSHGVCFAQAKLPGVRRFFLGPTDFKEKKFSRLKLRVQAISEGTIRLLDSESGNKIFASQNIIKNEFADEWCEVVLPCEALKGLLEPVLEFTGEIILAGFYFL